MADEQATPDAAREKRVSEIRLIALSTILRRDIDLDFWSYYMELNALKQRPLSTDWLEASVMLACIGKVRPARTMGFLKKLREKRAKNDDLAVFEAFDADLRAFLDPVRLTNHGFASDTFADIDHDSVWQRVSTHLMALREEGYEVFLNSGTLLGVVRDARLIDHDDDVDLALVLHAGTEAEAAQEWSELRRKLEAMGLFDAQSFKPDQPAIYKLTPAGQVQVDLFPAWIEDGKVFVYPHTHGALDREDVLPLRPCALTGHALPADPAKMLQENYGEGWANPDPLFKFPWKAANDRFAPFLERLAQ
jgi:hypothetical protein